VFEGAWGLGGLSGAAKLVGTELDAAKVVGTELDAATGLDKITAEELMVDFLAGGVSFVAIISFF
jgi:hypothetical protein